MRMMHWMVSILALFLGASTAPARSPDDGARRPPAPFYSGSPNHREIALRAFALAVEQGFLDTVGIDHQTISDLLEAGAYDEDYAVIPGVLGVHISAPWNGGPEFDFNGLYPFSRIPYGSLDDTLSGWLRGSPHGYDPLDGFTWPGTKRTTVDWADDALNTFTWDHALGLYRSGNKKEAYECVGHLLHLLADLSIPEHVKIINHGISLTGKKGGSLFDPDIATLVVDEYELSLAGGVGISGVAEVIPDLLGVFRNALAGSRADRVPAYGSWKDYFVELATLTAEDSLVNRYYGAPAVNGQWGIFRNDAGDTVAPTQYAITPPAKIGDRWTQIALASTANPTVGTIIPHAGLEAMCDTLVPKAAEYCAGLLLLFLAEAAGPEAVGPAPVPTPGRFSLEQNYPNPFNPSTRIRYSIPRGEHVTLRIVNTLGQVVRTLVDGRQSAGERIVTFDAQGLPSGVYFCQLQAGTWSGTRKLILMK